MPVSASAARWSSPARPIARNTRRSPISSRRRRTRTARPRADAGGGKVERAALGRRPRSPASRIVERLKEKGGRVIPATLPFVPSCRSGRASGPGHLLLAVLVQLVEELAGGDRKSVVSGKGVSVRVELGGPRILKK